MTLKPGSGWAEVRGGYATGLGMYGQGEVGAHLRPNLGLFGFGRYSQAEQFSAGIGARFTW